MFADDDDIIQGLQIQAPTKDSIILEGVLKKKSPKGFIKAWQERWIVLTRDGLFYYKAKDAKDVKLQSYQGAIPLRAIASILPTPRKGFRFDITLEEHYGRVFSFTAKTEQEVQKWIMQTTLAWNDVKDADKAAGVVQTAPVPGAAGAGSKIWRNPNAQVKNTKNDPKLQQVVAVRSQYPPEMQLFINSYKPLYKQLNPRVILPTVQGQPPSAQAQCEQSLQQVLSTLFSDFKVQSSDVGDNGFGAVYVLGNGHFQITHRSYLLHCIPNDALYVKQVVDSMQLIRDLRFPLFPTQIHCGETADNIYSIYHPPLRSTTDTLFCWLQSVQRFPEHIVQWILIHIIITLQLLHQQGIIFHSLSPEFTYFDADGVLRIGDLLLSKDVQISSMAHNIPEYDPPEVVNVNLQFGSAPGPHTQQAHTPAGDFWRLGVFLYELSTGLPPFRATEGSPEDQAAEVYRSIQEFNGDLLFPPFISKPLQDLITQLLRPDPSRRLSSIDAILQHAFLAGADPQLFDITYLLTQAPKPQWIIDNIIAPLNADENTPQNLTFLPDQPLVHRLHCQLLQLRHLTGAEHFSKVQLQILLEPDTYKTRQIALDGSGPTPSGAVGGGMAATGGRESVFFSGASTTPKSLSKLGNEGLTSTLSIPIEESFTFDFVHPNNTSFWPDLVLEVHGQKREAIKDPKTPQQADLTKANTLLGFCTIPLSSLRAQTVTEGWFTFFSTTTMEPCGEIHLDLQWESEFVSLDSGVLSGLTDSTRLFPQCFGRIVPAPNKKLWSTIVDSSANPYDPPAIEDASGVTSQDLHNLNLTTNIGTLAQQPSLQQIPVQTQISFSQLPQQSGGGSGGGGGGGSGQYPALGSPGSFSNGSSQFPSFQASSPQSSPLYAPSPPMHSRHTLLGSQTGPILPPPVPALPPTDDSLPIPPPVPAFLPMPAPLGPPPVPPIPPIPPPVPPSQPSQLPPPHDQHGEVLPPNWKRAVQPDTGAIYYYNRITKAVSWSPPSADDE